VESRIRVWVHDTWLRNPSLGQRPETRPRHAVALAPSPYGTEPVPLDLDLEALQTLHIAWHAVIIVALIGFQGPMLLCASETRKAWIWPLKNNNFKEG